jgi:hypothetical protein
MRIERIVITGDVLRTSIGEANQLPNVRWLHEELRGVLHALTGLSPEITYRRNTDDDGLAVISDWYGRLGHVPSVKAWAATYAMTAPPALIDALAPDYERALVIGFELSPILRSALDSIGVPWIDMEVSPIRFLDDLALTVRLSWPVETPAAGAGDRRPHPGLVSPGLVEEAVDGLRARHRNDTEAAACSHACIFLAQTRHDRTLIRDGGFFPDDAAIARVAGMLGGRPLILKPHPLQLDNPLLAALQERLAAPVTGVNIYALLAAARDVRFVTISSSAAIEARQFGHVAAMLHPDAHDHPASFTSLWAHRSAAFWRTALGSILPVRADSNFEERLVPDRLRQRLNAWGFTRPPAGVETKAPTLAASVLEDA